jgi:hypothetical protein
LRQTDIKGALPIWRSALAFARALNDGLLVKTRFLTGDDVFGTCCGTVD